MEQDLTSLLRSTDDREYFAALALLSAAHADTVGAFGSLATRDDARRWAGDLQRSADAARCLFEVTARAAGYGAPGRTTSTDVREATDRVSYAMAAGYAGHLELPIIHVAASVPATLPLEVDAWTDLVLHLLNAGAHPSHPAVLDLDWLPANQLGISLRERAGRGRPSAAARAAGVAATRLGATTDGERFTLSLASGASPEAPLINAGVRPTFGVRGNSPLLSAIAERLTFLGLERNLTHPDVWFADAAENLDGRVIVPGALGPAGSDLELPVQQQDLEDIITTLEHRPSLVQRLYILDASEQRTDAYARGAEASGRSPVTGITPDAATPELDRCDAIVLDAEDPGFVECLRQWRRDGCDAPALAILTHSETDALRAVYELGVSAHVLTPVDALTLAEALARHTDGTEPVYDEQESVRIANERRELANEVVTMLVGGLDDDLGRIQRGLVTRDPESLRTNIHRLLGAVQYCAVPRLTQAVQTLRGSAHDLDWEAAARHLLALHGQAALLRFRFGT